MDGFDMSLEAVDRLALRMIAEPQPARMVRGRAGRVTFMVDCPTCGRGFARGTGNPGAPDPETGHFLEYCSRHKEPE
jgi:hypothetical protein